MADLDTPIDDYYFVPLGRERGGYLDHLELPPTAKPDEISKRAVAKEKEAERKYKEGCKEANSQFKDGVITKEEQAKLTDQIKEEKEKQLRSLRELKAAYDLKFKESREWREKGFRAHEQVWRPWLPMYPELGRKGEAIRQALLSRRPRAGVSPAMLRFIVRHWIEGPYQGLSVDDPESDAEESLGKLLDARPARLFDALRLATVRDLVELMTADALWGKLKFTNRAFWRERIADWEDSIALLGPGMKLRRTASAPAEAGGEFPALSGNTQLSVDRLQSEEIEDLSKLPDRRAAQTPRNLFAELFGRVARADQAETGATPDPASGEPAPGNIPIELLLELMDGLFGGQLGGKE